MIFSNEKELWYAETEILARQLANKSEDEIMAIFDSSDVIQLRVSERPQGKIIDRMSSSVFDTSASHKPAHRTIHPRNGWPTRAEIENYWIGMPVKRSIELRNPSVSCRVGVIRRRYGGIDGEHGCYMLLPKSSVGESSCHTV